MNTTTQHWCAAYACAMLIQKALLVQGTLLVTNNFVLFTTPLWKKKTEV